MAVIVETGTGSNPAANSYVSLTEVRAFASARGVTLPVSDTEVEVLIVKAMDFLSTLGVPFKGAPTSETQPLQWPRAGVYMYDGGPLLDDDVIPSVLKSAQCQLSVDALSTDLQPNGTGREVVREKVDVLEVQYAERGTGTVTPQLTKAMAFLSILLERGTALSQLRSVRI